MGNKTGSEAQSDQKLLERICHALDEPPRLLAHKIGVPWKEFEELLNAQTRTDIDRDIVWWKLMDYVNERLGQFMAAKVDLNRALQRDRARRILRREKTGKAWKRIKK